LLHILKHITNYINEFSFELHNMLKKYMRLFILASIVHAFNKNANISYASSNYVLVIYFSAR